MRGGIWNLLVGLIRVFFHSSPVSSSLVSFSMMGEFVKIFTMSLKLANKGSCLIKQGSIAHCALFQISSKENSEGGLFHFFCKVIRKCLGEKGRPIRTLGKI